MGNEAVGARIVGNTGILIGSQVITKTLGTILTIMVARRLGVEDYGLYQFALNLGGIFGIVAGFGLSRPVAREVARRLEASGEILGDVLILEGLLSSIALMVMTVTALILSHSTLRLVVIVVAGATMIINATLRVIAAFFQAHQRMHYEAFMRVSLSLLNLALGALILWTTQGVLPFVWVQLGVFGIALGLGLTLASRISRPRIRWRPISLKKLVGQALPFALSGLFIFVYDGMATILLSLLRGDEVTGLYAGAMNFVRVFGLIPTALLHAAFPVMAQYAQSSPNAWQTVFQRSLKYLIIVALPVSTGLALLSDQLVHLVLGQAYAGSAIILFAVAWTVILVFANHGLTNGLYSVDKEKVQMRLVALAMVVNLGINLALIPRLGALGAVTASLATEGLMLAMQWLVLKRAGVHVPLASVSAKPILAVLAMAVAVWLARQLGLVAAIAVGALIYPLMLWLLGTLEPEERQILKMGLGQLTHRASAWCHRRLVRGH